MPERRIFARHTPTALTYVSAGDANGGILLNVSEAGCALQLVSPPPTLSDVSLDLDLGSTLPRIEVAGKVIWADETGCTGVRFGHLSEVARQTIRRFVENNPADPAMPEIGTELEQEIVSVGDSMSSFASSHPPMVAEDPLMAAAPEREEEVLFDSVEEKSFEAQLFELSTGAAFVSLVEECRTATGASSAALALLKGREMLCRASCGKGAPPTGARLDITSERSFTAQCVSTATTLRCVDSQTDSRVNAAVCQRLGIRSVTAMPLIYKDQVVGVLEVFSSERDAFSEGHISGLERLGKLAVDFAIARNEVTLAPTAPAAAWPANVKQAAPRAPERPSIPAAPAVSKPAPSFSSTYASSGVAAVAVAPAMAPSPNIAAASTVIPAPVAPKIEAPRPVEVPAVEKKPELRSEAEPQAKPEAESKPEVAQAAPVVVPAAAKQPAPAVPAATSVAPAINLAPIFGQAKSSIAAPEVKEPKGDSLVTKTPSATPAAAAPPAPAAASATRMFEAQRTPAANPNATAAPATTPAFAPARKQEAVPDKRDASKDPGASKEKNRAAEKRVEAAKPAPVAKAVAKPAPKKDDRFEVAPLADDPQPAWSSKTSSDAHETVFGAEGESKIRIPTVAAAAVVLVALIGSGVWGYRATHRAAQAQPVQTAAAPAPAPTGVQEIQVTAPASSTPSTSSSKSSGKESGKEKDSAKDSGKEKNSKDSKSSSASSSEAAQKSDGASKTEAAPDTSDKQPQVIALAQSSGLRARPSADVAPPTITSSTALPTLVGTAPSLPSLSAPQAGSSGPLKVSSAALTDRIIKRLEPQYPEIARRSGLSGAVRLRLEIASDGKVKSATVLEGAPVLASAARDAVLQWRYRPYVVDNRPVPIETEIIVRFTAR